MGPVPRTKRDIETAVARLADPEVRIDERLWWFCSTPPATDQPAPTAADTPSQHDAALVQLHRALITQTGQSLGAWQDLLRRFEKLADSGDYLTWLLAVEAEGDFEKRATPEEVAAGQSGLTARLQTALAENIETALDDENFSAAREAIQLMQRSSMATSATSAAAVVTPAEKVLGRLEDLLIQRCEALRDQVHQAWNTRKIAILKPACRRCLMEVPKQLVPLIEELRVLCPHDVDRVQRAQVHGANVLIYTADALEGCYDFMAAERALTQACMLVNGTAMESTIQRRIDATSLNARRQRLGAGPASSLKPSAGGTVPSNRPFKLIGSGNRNYGGSWITAFPKRGIIIVTAMVLSALARFMSMQPSTPVTQEPFPQYQQAPPAPDPRIGINPAQPAHSNLRAPHLGL